MKAPGLLDLVARSRSEGRGRPLLAAAIILASFAAGGWMYFRWAAANRESRIATLEARAASLLAQTVPLRFTILSRSGGAMRVRVALYDLAGAELVLLERNLPGESLSVDLILVPARAGGEAYLAFPYRLSTEVLAPASGPLLFDSYDSGGFPGIFGGAEWGAKDRTALVSAYAYARRAAKDGAPAAGSEKGSSSSALHRATVPARFELGISYKVVCRSDGALDVMKD